MQTDPVEQVEQHRDQYADQQKAVAQHLGAARPIDGIADELGDLEQGEIELFIDDPLPGEEIDDENHHQVAEQYKNGPAQEDAGPGLPGNRHDDLQPAHVPAGGQAVIHQLNGFIVAGNQSCRQQRFEGFLPLVADGGEVERGGEVDQKGSSQAGIGDSGTDDHLNPDNQELGSAEQGTAPEDFAQQQNQDSQHQIDEKGCQRKMAAAQWSGAMIDVVDRRQQADRDGKDQADQNGPQPDLGGEVLCLETLAHGHHQAGAGVSETAWKSLLSCSWVK